MSTRTSARWYAVQTQVNGEAKAAENLRRQGFDTYLPRYLKRRRHARRVHFTAKPLFPRYMFVAIDVTTQRWRSIQSTSGVSRLITNGDELAVVPDAVISALQAREDEKGFVIMDTKPTLAPGDKVRILVGAFVDNAGLFSGATDSDRIAILLEMLGRQVRVVLDRDMVTVA